MEFNGSPGQIQIICIKSTDRVLSIKGYGKIQLLATGNAPKIVLNGFTLVSGESHWFYSPMSHSGLQLIGADGEKYVTDVGNLFEADSEEYERLHREITKNRVIGIVKVEWEFSGDLSKLQLYRKLFPVKYPQITSSTTATISFTDAEENFIDHTVTSSSRIICTGPKNSGKSTFNRYLVNRLLSKFPGQELIYLDLDPGQTEFTPPSFLSLTRITSPIFGPPFTHDFSNLQILKQVYFGELSPGNCSHEYLSAAKSLVTFYMAEHADAILVVNTMGWVSGRGLQILGDLYRMIQPTDIVQLEQTAKRSRDQAPTLSADVLDHETVYYNRSVDELEHATVPADFLHVARGLDGAVESEASSSRKVLSINAPEHRCLMISMQLYRSLTKTITLPLSSLCITVMDPQIPQRLYLATINKQLVALFSDQPAPCASCTVLCGASTSIQGTDEHLNPDDIDPESLYTHLAAKPSPPERLNCLGMGFVKNITTGEIEMLVPGHVDSVATVVKGRRGLELNEKQLTEISNSYDYVDSFNREDIIRGSDFFIKTKRVFRLKAAET